MKKSGVILGLLVVSVLLISIISFANTVSGIDIVGKITGRVTEENITDGDVEPESPVCMPTPQFCPDGKTFCPSRKDEQGCTYYDCDSCETPPECTDSDRGKDYYVRGTLEISCAPGKPCPESAALCGSVPALGEPAPTCLPPSDWCASESILNEGYCENGNILFEEHTCSYACKDGACTEPSEPPGPPPFDPQCVAGEKKPYICEDGTELSWCECENENWVCKISVEDDCPEIDEPKTCAAEIKIAFNKDVYKIGDPIKIIIEILDLQGNHLPNYAFYAQMYDDRWHTPDLQKTDNKGYFIHTGTAEKPPQEVTEVKFKVYTKETNSCSSVEDVEEVKFELGECGIGGCVPEPGCKNKIKKCGGKCPPCPGEDDEEIFYPCSGCELEDKCYPFGYRKEARYCSDNYEFVNQIEEGKCDNSFECESNVCISGECVEEGLMRRIIVWFKKLFGGGDGEEPGQEICSKILIEKDIEDWEYTQSLYGSTKESQVPAYSKDGIYLDTIKCCMAGYRYKESNEEKAALVCPYDNRQDLENSLYWILVKEQGLSLDFDLTEYKDEKVYGSADIAIVWTSKAYLVASGGDPRVGTPLSEDITDAYLKKYKNDLEEIDISYIPDIEPKIFVFCTEEDKEAAKECHDRGGAGQSNPSTFDGTEESKKKCKASKGFGEGCCEVYTGCIMPDEDCEEIKIVGSDECYWHVARLNQDADLCEKITENYYKDKCLRDVVTTTQDSSTCEKITDDIEKEDCYVWSAIENNDASICENIDIILQRNKCYIHISQHTGDASICENVDDSSLREKCYFWVAEQEGDVGSCEGIDDADLQAMCYIEIAEKAGDASFCDKITDSNIADKCYRDVGIQTNDRSLCEKIIEDKAKQKCLTNTS
jgi:hypothetical protein